MGNPASTPGFVNAVQRQVELTPTQSKMTFTTPTVALYLTFGGNYDPNDLQSLSAPLGFITMQVQSLDGASHDVQLYADVSAEWSHGTVSALVGWQAAAIPTNAGDVTAFAVTPTNPNVLGEDNDYADWGTEVWATGGDNLTMQSGEDVVVRGAFVGTGALNDSQDASQPRAISNNWPVFAFAYALPNTTGALSPLETFIIGNVRQPAVSYLGANVAPLWQSYWSSWQLMVRDVFASVVTGVTQTRAEANDRAMFINALYTFANTTPSLVPFTDWYDTLAGTQNGFQARPVVGGVFSLLARDAAGTLPTL